MAIKALEGGRYKVDIRPQGRTGRRVQRIFNKKADAIAFERNVMLTANNQEWKANVRDYRPLSEIFKIWWNYKGRNLTWGNNRRTAIMRLIKDMGDPAIYQMTAKFISSYRSDRLHNGVKASTINRDLALLMGIFTTLKQIGEFSGNNPIKSVPRLKEKKRKWHTLHSTISRNYLPL